MNYEKRKICPYNRAHIVPPERFALHISKCKKQHPDIILKICPFNATHHVKEEEFMNHLQICDSTEVAEKTLYVEKLNDLNALPAHATNNVAMANNTFLSEEDWDRDIYKGTYDPQKVLIDKPIIRQAPFGLGKATRQKWNQIEQERVERLKKGKCTKDLVFPNPDGTEAPLEEQTRDDEFIPGYILNKQQQIIKNKKVASSPNKSKIAANIFGVKGAPNMASSTSSSSDENVYKNKRPMGNRRSKQSKPVEVECIFAPYSKSVNYGNNVQGLTKDIDELDLNEID